MFVVDLRWRCWAYIAVAAFSLSLLQTSSVHSLFHLVRLFWYHVLMCFSVSPNVAASFERSCLVKYFCWLNLTSKLSSCELENVVLFFLFPQVEKGDILVSSLGVVWCFESFITIGDIVCLSWTFGENMTGVAEMLHDSWESGVISCELSAGRSITKIYNNNRAGLCGWIYCIIIYVHNVLSIT